MVLEGLVWVEVALLMGAVSVWCGVGGFGVGGSCITEGAVVGAGWGVVVLGWIEVGVVWCGRVLCGWKSRY